MVEPFTESYGFTGPFPQEAWSDFSALGGRYLVSDVGSWRVTATPNQRGVTVAAGAGRNSGVWGRSASAKPFTIPSPGTGKSRWYEVARRTRWGEVRSDEFVLTPYPEASTLTVPKVRPLLRPDTALSSPGVVDDQPIAYVWVRSSDNTVVVIDARLVGTPSGPLPAASLGDGGLRWFPRDNSDRPTDQFAGGDFRGVASTGTLPDMPRGIYQMLFQGSVIASQGCIGSVRLGANGDNRDIRADNSGTWYPLSLSRRFYHSGGELVASASIRFTNPPGFPVPGGTISNDGSGLELYLERAL